MFIIWRSITPYYVRSKIEKLSVLRSIQTIYTVLILYLRLESDLPNYINSLVIIITKLKRHSLAMNYRLCYENSTSQNSCKPFAVTLCRLSWGFFSYHIQQPSKLRKSFSVCIVTKVLILRTDDWGQLILANGYFGVGPYVRVMCESWIGYRDFIFNNRSVNLSLNIIVLILL